jgi:hypothetical protein
MGESMMSVNHGRNLVGRGGVVNGMWICPKSVSKELAAKLGIFGSLLPFLRYASGLSKGRK